MNRELLEKKFDESQIRQRKGNFGRMLDYIEGHAVIQRLNDAFDSDWSFHIVSHEILENEVIVCGALCAGNITKQQFGSSQITRNSQDNSIISLGDDLKSATTDALKKAATLLGVGLHLYGEKESSTTTSETKKDGNGSNNASASIAQVRAITGIAKTRNIGSKELSSLIREVAGVDKVELLDKKSASKIISYLNAA